MGRGEVANFACGVAASLRGRGNERSEFCGANELGSYRAKLAQAAARGGGGGGHEGEGWTGGTRGTGRGGGADERPALPCRFRTAGA